MSKWRFRVYIQDTRNWYVDFEEEGDGTYDEVKLYQRATEEIDRLLATLPEEFLEHTNESLGETSLYDIQRHKVG